MRQITQEEQDAVLDVLRRNRERLLAVPGAHHADVGYEYKAGDASGHLAIRVFVTDKRAESELPDAEILPTEIEGVPVDVIESAPLPHGDNPRDGRFEPLVGGVGIANANPRCDGFGTLGTVVHDAVTGLPLGLSNYHVLVQDVGTKGDPIVQPSAGSKAANLVGTLERWDQTLDAAVFTLTGARTFARGIVDHPGGAQGIGNPLVGTPVTKSGRSTQTTFGIIDGVSDQKITIMPDKLRPSPGEISAPGDSGSVWLRVDDYAAVGLHFAGEDPRVRVDRAWAADMNAVARSLRIVVTMTMPSLPGAQGDTLPPGGVLHGDDVITSPDGMFRLVYQVDGNLVLYRVCDGRPTWASGTKGKPVGVCVMQADGNLVIYDPVQRPVWSSGTHEGKDAGSRLVLQTDGNLVLYRPDDTPSWDSGTRQNPLPVGAPASGDTMQPGQVMHRGDTLTAADGSCYLVYQPDGNLVLYRRSDDVPVWASGTRGRSTGVCMMQSDGNLVVYDADSKAVWASDTDDGDANSRLVVRPGGVLTIYRPDGSIAWSTGPV
ncbi:hypothetical protein [Actinocorallia sp. A-T 12471]|uniref:hypothetical protein n=1 Tax=Actinocorallia sp. A-T 12471 TaxID=3089813 RepID=UPI0029CE73F7|nr:hypothetical protein [Actinocorallia sp. A-T 12471]MDX6744158.1 hypothetical protein [Actinocorallia sp. A-T 12471]